METGLKLLMRDGPVSLHFSPDLNDDQYGELLSIVQAFAVKGTVADLRQDVESAAQRWGVTVTLRVPVRLPGPGSSG
jgi:hypothetical protein